MEHQDYEEDDYNGEVDDEGIDLQRSMEKQAKELELNEKVKEQNKGAIAKLREEQNIVKRARKLFAAGAIQFPDVKKVRQGDMFISQPLPTDQNKKAVLDAMFEGEEHQPRHDLFRGRVVDQDGVIVDDHYAVLEWVEAFAAGGMKGMSAKATREFLREWAFHNKQNDLIRYIEKTLPEWDGKERMGKKLIEIFECHDTPLNRDFDKYFWLSLYSRVVMPGSQAPMVLSLFGAQGCGKSRFGKELSRIITGNEESDSITLDLGGDKVDFLRDITGHSVVAAVGEMTGFTRGDLNKIKDFVTRDADPMHHKFEGHFVQPRQWITVMDGNKYEGLQRDETGNRRFYPMFCGQLPDYLGKPAWRAGFVVKPEVWATLHDEVWQLMAEAAKWFEDNGESGYDKFVGGVINDVYAFSKKEMERDSGTITDDVFDVYLVPMLKEGPKLIWRRQDGHTCVGIKTGEFKRFFMDTAKHLRPNWRHLKNKMHALGAQEHAFSGGYPGFLFPQFKSVEEFEDKLGEMDFDDGGTSNEIKTAGSDKNGGGF